MPSVVPVLASVGLLVLLLALIRNTGVWTENGPQKPFYARLVASLVAGAAAGLALSAVAAVALRVVVVGLAAILIAAIIAGTFWLYANGNISRKPRTVSRGANSHYNANGTEKVPFDNVQDAQAAAARPHAKDGAEMAVYVRHLRPTT